MQYIVICLRDRTKENPATYVQPSRKRFVDEDAALDYMQMIAPSRLPAAVKVPDVTLDEKGYPKFNA